MARAYNQFTEDPADLLADLKAEKAPDPESAEADA